jgi:hypothetical protein
MLHGCQSFRRARHSASRVTTIEALSRSPDDDAPAMT